MLVLSYVQYVQLNTRKVDQNALLKLLNFEHHPTHPHDSDDDEAMAL